jgi:hypothetical protein
LHDRKKLFLDNGVLLIAEHAESAKQAISIRAFLGVLCVLCDDDVLW